MSITWSCGSIQSDTDKSTHAQNSLLEFNNLSKEPADIICTKVRSKDLSQVISSYSCK